MDQTPADKRTPHVRCLREREEGQRGRGGLGWLGGHLLGRLAAQGAGGDGRRRYVDGAEEVEVAEKREELQPFQPPLIS